MAKRTETDCWDMILSGAQTAADCAMNRHKLRLPTTISSSNSLLYKVTFFMTFSHIFSHHIGRHFLCYASPYCMYYVAEATGAKSLALCNVYGRKKMNTIIILMQDSSFSLSHPRINKSTQSSHKGIQAHTHTHNNTGTLDRL